LFSSPSTDACYISSHRGRGRGGGREREGGGEGEREREREREIEELLMNVLAAPQLDKF
jgi:hypothetical protein